MTDLHEQAAAPLPRVRSHFDIVTPRPWPDVVAIVDRDDGAMSITNDAENVVRRLHVLGVLRAGDLLVYRDSDLRWDAILHDGNGNFLGIVTFDIFNPSMSLALNAKVRV